MMDANEGVQLPRGFLFGDTEIIFEKTYEVGKFTVRKHHWKCDGEIRAISVCINDKEIVYLDGCGYRIDNYVIQVYDTPECSGGSWIGQINIPK